jgi:hypothetical protein
MVGQLRVHIFLFSYLPLSVPHFLFLVMLGNVRRVDRLWRTTRPASTIKQLERAALPTNLVCRSLLCSGRNLSRNVHGFFFFSVLDGAMVAQDLKAAPLPLLYPLSDCRRFLTGTMG